MHLHKERTGACLGTAHQTQQCVGLYTTQVPHLHVHQHHGWLNADCDIVGRTVAHQMLSAGKGKAAVMEFLQSHRMGHLLHQEDLHQTLERISPPLPAARTVRLSATVCKFTKRVTARNSAHATPERALADHGVVSADVVAHARMQRQPSRRLRCRSVTSVTGTWGPSSGTLAPRLLDTGIAAGYEAAMRGPAPAQGAPEGRLKSLTEGPTRRCSSTITHAGNVAKGGCSMVKRTDGTSAPGTQIQA
jgi:hypothetical protein